MVLDLGVSPNTAIIKRNKILTLDADTHDTWNLLNVFYLIIRSADADIVLTVYYHQYPGGGGRRCAAMCPCGKAKEGIQLTLWENVKCTRRNGMCWRGDEESWRM